MRPRGGAKTITYLISITVLLFVPFFMGVGMQSNTGQNNYQKTADALYAAIKNNRNTFDKFELLKQHETTVAEHWIEDKNAFKSSQMFQNLSIQLANAASETEYRLESLWAINQNNFPGSDKEREGLIYILKNPGENYYTHVELAGKKYFMAVYPYIAISQACVQCHNSNKLSPKTDFQVGDLMGGVVLRIPREG